MSQKRVLITGASSGIGAEIAREFSQKGYFCLLLGRSQERLAATGKSLEGDFQAISCDITSEQQLSKVIAGLASDPQNATLTCLVNNAGIFTRIPFEETGADEWKKQFATTVLGPTQLTRGLLHVLKKNSPSSIINVSSTAGLRPVHNTSAYSSMKAAMNMWTKSLALEVAPAGVRVNAVCPGVVDTPIHSLSENPEDENRKMMNDIHPLGRMGTSSEIAKAVHFLASEDSAWTTGSIVTVDGGITLA